MSNDMKKFLPSYFIHDGDSVLLLLMRHISFGWPENKDTAKEENEKEASAIISDVVVVAEARGEN
jgi:hypothetical protein